MLRFTTTTFVALAAVLAAGSASAQQARWLDGGFGFVPGLACVTGNAETELTTFTGYWGTLDGSFPRTGDVSYIRAVGAVVGNPCSGGDAVGFDFFPPAGASVAVSAQNPVRCIGTRLSDGFTTTTDPNIHCSQTPSNGTNGGLFFGYAVAPRGWAFEIQVPVQFNRELKGLAGPRADNLKVIASSTNGTQHVEAWVTVPLRGIVNYPAPSARYDGVYGQPLAAHYLLTSYVYNYYAAGTAYLEAGTASGVYGPPVTSATIPNTGNGYSVTFNLGLNIAYTGNIYWRTRLVTTTGATFTGTEQSFTANGQTPATYSLTVTKNGTGSGAVTSDPQGLDCGSRCTESFTAATRVTLTASPGPGSQFTAWSGACTGTAPCTVTMNAAANVTATFNALPPVNIGTLEVTPFGLPAGATSSIAVTGPGGFNHAFNIPSGTAASLSDVVAGEYNGVAANVVVGADTWVPRPATPSTAVLGGGRGVISTTYTLGRALTVTKAGAGAGTVASNPAALLCGSTCTSHFPDGETVTLTAAAASGSHFAGWSGDCTGTGSCQLAMNAARSVAATFASAATGDGPAPSDPMSSGGCSTAPAASPMAAVVLLAVLAATRARRRENNARLARAGRAAASGPAGSGGFSSEVDLLQRQRGTEAAAGRRKTAKLLLTRW